MAEGEGYWRLGGFAWLVPQPGTPARLWKLGDVAIYEFNNLEIELTCFWDISNLSRIMIFRDGYTVLSPPLSMSMVLFQIIYSSSFLN